MARRIGSRYTVHQVLGRGSAGTVWLGTGPEGPAAIKLLREDLSADQVLVGRFVQERTALTSLTHPHIVQVRDLVVDGDDLALVMELVRGTDLRAMLEERGTLAPQVAVSIAADLCTALAAAHAAGVVHRDVKPENVLLDVDAPPGPGGAPRAKLTDFGIARLVDSPRRTRTTRIIGTPDYLAPEVIEGLPPTAAVDVYALATLLYELIAGFTPFGGGHPGAVLRRHVIDAVPPIPGLAPELWRLITTCLSKAPASRLTAAELAVRLEALLPGITGAPTLHPRPPRQDAPEDRPRAGAAAPAAATRSTATAGRGVPHQQRPRRDRRAAESLVPPGDGHQPDEHDTHTNLRRPSAEELAAMRRRGGGGPAAARVARARHGGHARGRAEARRRRLLLALLLAVLVLVAVVLAVLELR